MSAMSVIVVKTSVGTHIEPPLDPHWLPLDRLRWKAAVEGLYAGEVPVIQVAKYTVAGVPQVGYYNIQVGCTSISPLTYNSAWDWLNGYSAGACVAKVRTERATRSMLAAADQLELAGPASVADWLRGEAADIAERSGLSDV